ncbi:MAG TPA: hypothetical protein VHI51_01675 [Ktedonobacterales bacterium]|nr:hypothetical protein [Ktedonobacterales bacterium]
MTDSDESVPTTTTLYRPVGERELALIEAVGFRAFPPRLEWQPIFYPVTTEQYAATIARDWNARDGQRGFVTRFAVDSVWLRQFETHIVGSHTHEEYWIPAERLDEFNAHIVGAIEVIATFDPSDN